MNKKGGLFIAIIIIIALLVIFWQFFSVISRQCNKDWECGENRYCGSDFECHDLPEIHHYHFILPALIIAAGFIGAVILYKKVL